MEHPRHVSRSVAAVLILALVITGTVRPAGAQVANTSLGTSALANNIVGSDDTALGFAALFLNQSGSFNTAVGAGVLQSNDSVHNTGVGYQALLDNTTGGGNTAIGDNALFNNTTGGINTAIGEIALTHNTTGGANTATGDNALFSNTTGNQNTAAGFAALVNNTSGKFNIGVGRIAGSNLTTGDNNIDIGNPGVAGESNTIRIGMKGTQTRALIAGIYSSPIFGLPVVVNGNGRLGIQASSVRYKRGVRDMGDASAGLLRLRPVSFRYKQDPTGTLQYGLIAEEVERVYPELVIRNDDGREIGVRYDLLPALLLNELQKLVKKDQQKDAQIVALERRIGMLQKETTRIDMLTARLRALEQQARIARPERLAAATR